MRTGEIKPSVELFTSQVTSKVATVPYRCFRCVAVEASNSHNVSKLLTCVGLTAHTDVSVTGDWGCLVVAASVLVGHLGLLLS